MDDRSIYERNFTQTGLGGAHLEALKLIGLNKVVLDVGCSSGYLGNVLQKEKGCIVDGIEMDLFTAEKAKNLLRKVYVGSIEEINLIQNIKGNYDVLLLLDILEHVKDPLSVLINLINLVKPGGFVVASVPNSANWRVRFALLFGKFDYEESGILDKGHIRFFTLGTTKALFEKAGLSIVNFEFTFGAPPILLGSAKRSQKEFLKSIFKLPIKMFPGLLANQFVIKAARKI